MAKTETISQPTVIDSGSSGNIRYTRFSDGTQIVYGIAVAPAGETFLRVDYPVSFVIDNGLAPRVFAWGEFAFKVFRTPNSQPAYAILMEQSGAAAENYNFSFFAIGRWK